jgi:hypothetical protein
MDMDFDQWVKLLGAIGAFATVGFAVAVTIYKGLDRKSNGHMRAEQALSLLKSWDEVEFEGDDVRDVRARQRHREELLRRAFSATQTYLHATEPTLITQWQTLFIGAVGSFSTFWLLSKPFTGTYDEISVIAVLIVALATWVATQFTFSRVSLYKADVIGLRKAGSRAVLRRSAKSKKQRIDDKSEPLTVEEVR